MARIVFYIARHGKTMMNTLDKVQGWCDSPLTKEGIEVARYLGRGLRHVPFRSAYCSDLRRTMQTARITLEEALQPTLSITEEAGFREACFGSFEAGSNELMWGNASLFLQYTDPSLMTADIASGKLTYREVLDAIAKLDKDKMGMAETFKQLEDRSQGALRKIAEKEEKEGDANILIIAHGMSIVGMLYGLGGDKFKLGLMENASVCKVIYEAGEFTVESMGDMSYVKAGKELGECKKVFI